MAFIRDLSLDAALNDINAANRRVLICDALPTSRDDFGVTVNILGHQVGVTVGSAQDGDTDGRKVVVPAISTGTVSASGTASHWAVITDGTADTIDTGAPGDIVYASGSLTASQTVTSGNTFTLDAINITIRDAT